MLLQPITVPFSKSTLKPSVYTLRTEFYSPINVLIRGVSLYYNMFKFQEH